MQAHSMVAAAAVLQDPSRQDFCEHVTGVRSRLSGSNLPSCEPFNDVGVIDLDQCGISFCNEGVKGFEAFVTRAFEYVRSNVVLFAVLSGLFAFGEMVLLCTSVVLLYLHGCERVHTDHLPSGVINSSSWVHGTHLRVDPRRDFQAALANLQGDISPARHNSKLELLEWCNECLQPNYPGLQVNDFTSSWEDGRVLCGLVCAHRPMLLKWEAVRQPIDTGTEIKNEDKLHNVRQANAILKRDFGLTENQCVPAKKIVEACAEDALVEFVSLLKVLLTSNACKHARMLEANRRIHSVLDVKGVDYPNH